MPTTILRSSKSFSSESARLFAEYYIKNSVGLTIYSFHGGLNNKLYEPEYLVMSVILFTVRSYHAPVSNINRHLDGPAPINSQEELHKLFGTVVARSSVFPPHADTSLTSIFAVGLTEERILREGIKNKHGGLQLQSAIQNYKIADGVQVVYGYLPYQTRSRSTNAFDNSSCFSYPREVRLSVRVCSTNYKQ
jgi:hypothetical protein